MFFQFCRKSLAFLYVILPLFNSSHKGMVCQILSHTASTDYTNPSSPNSDLNQISPCNIYNAYSVPEVMRNKDMNTHYLT